MTEKVIFKQGDKVLRANGWLNGIPNSWSSGYKVVEAVVMPPILEEVIIVDEHGNIYHVLMSDVKHE